MLTSQKLQTDEHFYQNLDNYVSDDNVQLL